MIEPLDPACWTDERVLARQSHLPGDLTDDEVGLLTEVGLPGEVGPVFHAASPEPTVAPREQSDRHLLELGHDQEIAICLDLATHGVVAIDFEGNTPDRFVNTSLGSFLAMLCLLRRFWADSAGLDDDAYAIAAGQLTPQLCRIDQAAFSSEDTWWSLVTEQLEDGLM